MFFYLVITFTTRKPAKTNGITDGLILSEIRSVDTDRISDGLHILFGKMQRRGDVEFFQTILPTEWPRDSNWDSRTVTWHCHRWNHRRNVSVGYSIGKNHYIHLLCRHSLPLFLLFLLSHPTSHLPNYSQPPIQFSTILNTSTQVSYTLYVVTISVSCGFYHFFVSKSILFSFNI